MTASFKTISSPCSRLLVQEAHKRGISVLHVNAYMKKKPFLELNYRGRQKFFMGQSSSSLSKGAFRIVDDKALTKIYLSRAGVSVPEGQVFLHESRDQISSYADGLGYPVVLKPRIGSNGKKVYVGIETESNLRTAVDSIFETEDSLIVETAFQNGEEFRIMASTEKVFAVAKRIPANVCGDGEHTIAELVNIKNEGSRKELVKKGALLKIEIDDDVRAYLKEQNFSLDSIPEAGEVVYLRKNSNVSTGGDSIDYTDRIHPGVAEIAMRAIKAIPGLSYAGVDFITSKSITEDPTEESYNIIEINSSAGFDIHHFPYRGRSRNVAGDIIDLLFPETKGWYQNTSSEYMLLNERHYI